MSAALLVVRLVLAATFAVAGVGKLLDVRGSARAAREFGAPDRLAPVIGVGLPLLELGVAVALLPRGSARWAAAAAVVLLGIFLVTVGRAMARGEHPDCHCFGQIHSTPAGWQTLVRNGVLGTLAAFVLIAGWSDPGSSATGWIGHPSPVVTVLVVAVVLLAWFSLELLRQQGRILNRLESLERARGTSGDPARRPAGLDVGVPAPAFEVPLLGGGTTTLEDLVGDGTQAMLVFSDPGCGPCEALLPDVGRWQAEYAGRLTIALVSRGSIEANAAKQAAYSLTRVLLQNDREVAAAYEAFGTPSAVLISPDRSIASHLARGPAEIRAMVASALDPPSLIQVPGSNGNNGHVGIGERAPDLSLPGVDGETVALDDLRGRPSVLLFWNPACGFCRRMLDDLRALDTDPAADAPRLVVVSLGSAEDNQAMGLSAPVLTDRGGRLMAAFGSRGTPTAVLIDAEGRLASEVAVGAPAVLQLAGYREPVAAT